MIRNLGAIPRNLRSFSISSYTISDTMLSGNDPASDLDPFVMGSVAGVFRRLGGHMRGKAEVLLAGHADRAAGVTGPGRTPVQGVGVRQALVRQM